MIDLEIRTVRSSDLERVVEIESICFPPAEAASKEALKERIATFPDGFLVADLNGQLVGLINGAATNSQTIKDEMFSSMKYHIPNGDNLAIFGLDVLPEYQKRGIAAQLMRSFIETGEKSGRKKILLTCKENLIYYYEKFGFVNEEQSDSSHGGARWYDMARALHGS